jgi:hypothetical protein
MFLALACALLATANAAVEWAGVFKVSDAKHTWSMQQKGGKYADPTMKLVIVPTATPTKAGMEAVEAKGKTLINGTCVAVTGGQTMTPVAGGSCFDLTVTTAAATTTFIIDTTGLSGVVFFAQHMPTEFESTRHYFYDSKSVDIEPVAQESAGAHAGHDHGHAHVVAEKCQCLAQANGWKIDCAEMKPVREAVSYLEANKVACKVKGASKVCSDHYFIMQTHHDHCTHTQLPANLGLTIHDFEEFYDDCKILRQFDASLAACPAVACSTAKVDLGTAHQTMLNNNCSTSCASETCKVTFQKIVRAHDDCGEDTLPAAVEKALHAYEDICEKNLCNIGTQTVNLDFSTCPASSGARATAGATALLASAAAAVLAFA